MIESTSFENKNILVTGSSGLLGSWLIEDLLSMGCNVTGIAIDETKDDLLKSKNIFDKIEKFYIDVSSYKDIEKIILNKKFTFIFHLAAQTQVTEALSNPLRTLESNIKGTFCIRGFRSFGICKMVCNMYRVDLGNEYEMTFFRTVLKCVNIIQYMYCRNRKMLKIKMCVKNRRRDDRKRAERK